MGNLAYDLSEQDVIDFFSKVGPVKAIRYVRSDVHAYTQRHMHILTSAHSNPQPKSCRIVTERDTGKPRGFGFVEFYDIPTAESCIRNLNGADLNGRQIRIVFAEGGPGEYSKQGRLGMVYLFIVC